MTRVLSLIFAAILLSVLAVLAACNPRKTERAMELAGCPRIDEGPICIIEPNKPAELTIFVEGELGEAAMALDGAPLEFRRVAFGGGTRIDAAVSKPGRLTIEDNRRRLTVDIGDRGRARAEDVATSTTARAMLRSGEVDKAVRTFDRSASAHLRSGARSDAIRDLQAAAYTLVYVGHRPEEASDFLDRAEPLLDGFAEWRGLQPYFRGLVARASADPERALADFALAKERLLRVGLAQHAIGVEEVEAATLEELGRSDAAQALLLKLAEGSNTRPCERARRMNNVAYVGLLEADRREEPANALTRRALDEARTSYDLAECRGEPGRERALLHAALAAVLDGDFDRAKRTLDETRSEQPGLEAELWRFELAARIAAGQKRFGEALELLERASTRARATLVFDALWRIELWRARIYDLAGRTGDAIGAYEEAERVLDDRMLRLPLTGGRTPFLADRSASAHGLAELFLEQRRERDAACVLRRSRSRALLRAASALSIHALGETKRSEWMRTLGELERERRELEAREHEVWSLPADQSAAYAEETKRRTDVMRERIGTALALIERDVPPASCAELRAPEARELVLLFEPLRHGAVAFALSDQRVHAHRFSDLPADVAAWIAPFASELEAAERVRVLAGAAIDALSFEAAIAHDVVYALDLPARAETNGRAVAGRAVVVADPRRNLAGARAEGERVLHLLQRTGWSAELLEGKQASAVRVVEAIEGSALFHYAGHATADRLELFESELYAEDVLALSHAPRLVVLDGCSTAKLAQAFILAGSRAVLATAEPISDALGEALAEDLYGKLSTQKALRIWVP